MTTADPTTTRPAAATGKRLLGVEEARATILSAVSPPDPAAAIPIALDQASGRVLATDVIAGLSMPRWPNSAMDGYALRLTDVGADGLPISQRVAAGSAPAPLKAGTAARIFTGAPVPDGTDTVVMQEHCRVDGDRVFVEKMPEHGANIRPAAEDFTRDEPVLAAGTHMRPQHIALAASAGAAGVHVHPRMRISLLITGDELVPPGEALGDGQIHESNGHMLAALGTQIGAEIQAINTVADDADATREALARAAADADLIVTSGGASVGDCDHVRSAAETIGELAFFGIAVKPGKPLAFGRVENTPLLVLPGNPVSLFVTFLLFGAPLLRRLQGRNATMPEALWVPAGFEQTRTRGRADYIRVRLEDGRAVPCGGQGSGILTPTAAADGLACIPPDSTVSPGEPLAYWPMATLLD
jgi:molybdopterin molybdotransferase